jgi:hypothetical protein
MRRIVRTSEKMMKRRLMRMVMKTSVQKMGKTMKLTTSMELKGMPRCNY